MCDRMNGAILLFFVPLFYFILAGVVLLSRYQARLLLRGVDGGGSGGLLDFGFSRCKMAAFSIATGCGKKLGRLAEKEQGLFCVVQARPETRNSEIATPLS